MCQPGAEFVKAEVGVVGRVRRPGMREELGGLKGECLDVVPERREGGDGWCVEVEDGEEDMDV